VEVKKISYLNVLLKMLCRYHLIGYSGFIRYALSFVLLMSLLVTNALAAPSEQSFIVGLLRPDGLIIPFAYFNGTDFINPWQKPRDYGPTDPNTITDLDVPWFSGLTAPTQSQMSKLLRGSVSLFAKSQEEYTDKSGEKGGKTDNHDNQSIA
jgi:hypothetical protein